MSVQQILRTGGYKFLIEIISSVTVAYYTVWRLETWNSALICQMLENPFEGGKMVFSFLACHYTG